MSKQPKIVTTGSPCTSCGVYEGTWCKHVTASEPKP